MYLQIVIWVERHNSRAFSLISFAFLLSGYGSVVCHMSCKPCGNCNSLYPVLHHGNVQWTKHHIHILAWFHRHPERTAVLSYVQLSKNLCHGYRLEERDWTAQTLSQGLETADWPKILLNDRALNLEQPFYNSTIEKL